MSGVLKDLKRCRSPTKRGVGVGVGWGSGDWSSPFGDIAGESPVRRGGEQGSSPKRAQQLIDLPRLSLPNILLLDLVEHAASQQAAINGLIGEGNRFTRDDVWEGFWNSLWGFGSFQGEERIEREADPVPSETPVVVVPETLPPAMGTPSRLILPRSEYDETEAAALEAIEDTREAFFVTGQPGIGPSPSHSTAHRVSSLIRKNLFLLMRRLTLQASNGITNLSHPYALLRSPSLSRVYVLVDSNSRNFQPREPSRTRARSSSFRRLLLATTAPGVITK